jgi:tRNA threonylcarbamoyladenosine biosynthesis protein TsaB
LKLLKFRLNAFGEYNNGMFIIGSMVAQPLEPIVLAIDTSSPQASFAIQRGDKLLATLATDNGTQHSKSFFSHLETTLQLAGIELSQLTAIAAVTGPGSFTGLRVGLAATQGLAQTLNIKSIGLNTLDVTALAASVAGRILVLLDAGRGEVFAGLRYVRPDGRFTQLLPDHAGRLENILHALVNDETHLFVTGSGAALLKLWAQQRGIHLTHSSHAHLQPTSWQILPTPSPLALALARYTITALPDVERHPLQACYIRPSDAEMKAVA